MGSAQTPRLVLWMGPGRRDTPVSPQPAWGAALAGTEVEGMGALERVRKTQTWEAASQPSVSVQQKVPHGLRLPPAAIPTDTPTSSTWSPRGPPGACLTVLLGRTGWTQRQAAGSLGVVATWLECQRSLPCCVPASVLQARPFTPTAAAWP